MRETTLKCRLSKIPSASHTTLGPVRVGRLPAGGGNAEPSLHFIYLSHILTFPFHGKSPIPRPATPIFVVSVCTLVCMIVIIRRAYSLSSQCRSKSERSNCYVLTWPHLGLESLPISGQLRVHHPRQRVLEIVLPTNTRQLGG